MLQLKDFLTLYNKVTEICFSRCIENLSGRELNTEEVIFKLKFSSVAFKHDNFCCRISVSIDV